MRLFAMVTTRSSKDYTVAALRSFFAHTALCEGDQFCLIDNDGCWIEADFPAPTTLPDKGFVVIHNSKPRSFAANANQAIRIALERGSDLFFLNDDLIFSANWLPPLEEDSRSLLSPLSNREVQYKMRIEVSKGGAVLSEFALRDHMTLDEYMANEAHFAAIAEAHRSTGPRMIPLLTLPFFCIRIPLAALEEVGAFDESFGIAGGEDFDYCLRAWAKGFKVCFALGTYVLHFGGRASWASGESVENRKAREDRFIQVFSSKWGEEIQRLAFNFDVGIADNGRGIAEAVKTGDFAAIIRALAGSTLPPLYLSPQASSE